MNQPHNLRDIADLMPRYDRYLDQYMYTNTLFHGHSDEEAYQLTCARASYAKHRYADPDASAELFNANAIPLQSAGPKMSTSEQLNNLERSQWNTCSREEVVNQVNMTDVSSIGYSVEMNTDDPAIRTQEDIRRSTGEWSSSPELTASPYLIPRSTSLREIPDNEIEQLAPSTTLPGTYAGRRSAQGRLRFPRECGACGRRFLYQDSAQKHYRKHHGEPTNIILRWNAPKRPPRGLPRNVTAARSWTGQSATFPVSSASPPSGSSSGISNSSEKRNVQKHAYNPISAAHDTSSGPSTFLAESIAESSPTAYSTFSNTEAPLQYFISPPLIRPDSTLGPGLESDFQNEISSKVLWPALENPSFRFPPEDARYAAVCARQIRSGALPDTAQEAIANANPQLMERQSQRSVTIDASPRISTESAVVGNIKQLRDMVKTGRCPRLPPDWAYEKNDVSLTWHAKFGKYYRRGVNGIWQAWCDETGCWEGE